MFKFNVTVDTIINDQIRIYQPLDGYRFSIDAVALANSIKPSKHEQILDLGTGCGVIPIILAHTYPDITLIGVEIQKELVDLANHNITINNFNHRIKIIHTDMKNLKGNGFCTPITRVICNPPYWTLQSGRMNPNEQRAIARHEIHATLNDIVETARRILPTSGHLHMVYPVDRMVDLITTLRLYHIEPKRMRLIHFDYLSDARLILVDAIKAAKSGLIMEKPFFINQTIF